MYIFADGIYLFLIRKGGAGAGKGQGARGRGQGGKGQGAGPHGAGCRGGAPGPGPGGKDAGAMETLARCNAWVVEEVRKKHGRLKPPAPGGRIKCINCRQV